MSRPLALQLKPLLRWRWGFYTLKMEETIKQHLEWLREDESRIVQTVKDSATHNALLRICNHLQFILSKLEEK